MKLFSGRVVYLPKFASGAMKELGHHNSGATFRAHFLVA
jgi:hypothetical protein